MTITDNRDMAERERYLELRIEVLTRALRTQTIELESAKLLIAQYQRMLDRECKKSKGLQGCAPAEPQDS